MNVKDQVIEIAGIPHYLARAAGPTTTGVLLIPHVTGIDHFVTTFADGLAERGLTTLAWNPYPLVPFGSLEGERPRPKDDATVRSLSGCLDVMRKELGLDAVATGGFCMGGRFALLFAAREHRLRAAFAAYPSIPAERVAGQDLDPVPAAASIACPVQVLYPGRDRVTPRAMFDALQSTLQGRDAETTILFYPKAEHGFMHIPSQENDAATRTARPQIYAFLEAHLNAQ